MRLVPASALFLGLALAACADPNPVDDFFTRWDANKDGIVTKIQSAAGV